MSLIKLSQPCNYIYKGREVIVESTEITAITESVDGTIIHLRDGRTFTVVQKPDEIMVSVTRARSRQ